MGRPHSRLLVNHSQAKSLPRDGGTYRRQDKCWDRSRARISSIPVRSLQLPSSASRDHICPMKMDLQALGNIRISTNARRQERKIRNRVQKQPKRDRATPYRDDVIENGISAVKWNHEAASTLGLIIVPEPQLGFEEYVKEFASSMAAMEYAIQQAAMQLAEENPTDVAGQETSHELELRARLFNFVRSHVIYSNSGSRDSARIKALNYDFLQDLVHSSPHFQNCLEFGRMIDLRLALLFDSALEFHARLAHSGEYRYELVQFIPGGICDPDRLKVQGTERNSFIDR